MSSSFSNLKFELIGTGEQSGTWGATTNANLGTAIEQAIVGMATLTSSDFTANVATLTLSNTTAAQNARALCLNIAAGAVSAAGTINVPAIQKPYLIINGSSYTVTVKVSGLTGVAVPAGERTVVYNNGTDVGEQVTYLTNLDLGTALPVASGGTGATTLTGLVKGSGTSAFTAATAGTDYVAPGTATTFTAKQTFSGGAATMAATLANALEVATISATAATGTINYDITTQSVVYYTSNASANWTVNFRASSGTSLNSAMATGESVTTVFMVTQGSTAYYNSAVTVDSVSVTPKWQGGSAPTSGNASGIDVYAYTIIKTGAATFTVLASVTQFK